MIKKYNFEDDRWWISTDKPHINGKLTTGLYLTSERLFEWFTTQAEYEARCAELGIEIIDDELNL